MAIRNPTHRGGILPPGCIEPAAARLIVPLGAYLDLLEALAAELQTLAGTVDSIRKHAGDIAAECLVDPTDRSGSRKDLIRGHRVCEAAIEIDDAIRAHLKPRMRQLLAELRECHRVAWRA